MRLDAVYLTAKQRLIAYRHIVVGYRLVAHRIAEHAVLFATEHHHLAHRLLLIDAIGRVGILQRLTATIDAAGLHAVQQLAQTGVQDIERLALHDVLNPYHRLILYAHLDHHMQQLVAT